MVDIRAFFGDSGKPKSRKSATKNKVTKPASSKKPTFEAPTSSKIETVDDTLIDVVDLDEEAKLEQDVLEVDDEPDGDPQEFSPSKARRKKRAKGPESDAISEEGVSESKVKIPKSASTSPKKPSRKRAIDSEPVVQDEPANSSNLTATDILSTIPDAKLPTISDENKKFNFFQSKQANAGQEGSGETVDIPEAKPNCLTGLTIVFTGVLPRMDRDTSENIAKRYGAKVTKSISGKTSLVVLGEDAGPSKVKKIKQFRIKTVDEDGFIQLLSKMPEEGGSGEEAMQARKKRKLEEEKLMQDIADEEEERSSIVVDEKPSQSSLQSDVNSQSQSQSQQRIIPDDEKLWTVKYAPNSIKQLCGNKGQIQKLHNWLENWFDNFRQGFEYPGADGSGIYRACLISGPPGIGKTSAAHLVAKGLGFDVLEKNASDVRSKSLLNSNVKSVLNNTSVVGFFKHRGEVTEHNNERKICLIMDEVDGMSSGDHGGAGALSAFCKITKMPLILICNDKSLPKMRTFDRNTFDLPFRRPSENEVKSRLMTIALRERIKLDPTVISQLVQATHNDIRQIINLLSTVSKTQKSIGHEQTKDIAKSWKKQTILKPFDITARLLNAQIYNPSSKHSLNDKIDLYFNDIDFTPLMVQENYLFTRPAGSGSTKDHLQKVANAADDISQSDRVNSLIRSSEQQWSLLPFHAVMSSIKPSSQIAGTVTQRINFAGWLGQNSKAMKYQRILQHLQYHTRLRTSADKDQLRVDYIPAFSKRLTNPLIKEKEEGIDEVIDFMDHYFLTKEDWDSVIDLGIGHSKADLVLKKVPTKVKSTLTRKYNAASHPVAIYHTGNSIATAGKRQSVDYEDVIEDDTLKDDDIEEDDADKDKIDTKKDKLIKEVRPKKSSTKKKASKK